MLKKVKIMKNISLTIDGKNVSAEEGMTIIQAANGQVLPSQVSVTMTDLNPMEHAGFAWWKLKKAVGKNL